MTVEAPRPLPHISSYGAELSHTLSRDELSRGS